MLTKGAGVGIISERLTRGAPGSWDTAAESRGGSEKKVLTSEDGCAKLNEFARKRRLDERTCRKAVPGAEKSGKSLKKVLDKRN